MSPPRSISGKEIDQAVTSDDLLGKDVIDTDGRFIGIVEKVFIHPEKLDFVGISIDKGFLKKGFSVGKDLIDRVGTHAIFLKISVAYEIRGLRVFDKDGKELGKVTGIALLGSGNDIDAIDVLSGAQKLRIKSKYIERIGYGVLLTIDKQEAIDLQSKGVV
jgi:sporulation protein YlmC with PRC-barrel domain